MQEAELAAQDTRLSMLEPPGEEEEEEEMEVVQGEEFGILVTA